MTRTLVWEPRAPFVSEMYSTRGDHPIALRPVGKQWRASVLLADGPRFSLPMPWRDVPSWLTEHGVTNIGPLERLGQYTSIFDVYGFDSSGDSPSPPKVQESQLVYFIQCGETGPIKIGIASDVKRRMASLQTACPFPLRLLATTAGGAVLERTLHDRFSGDRLRGEWFLPTSELLELVRGLA